MAENTEQKVFIEFDLMSGRTCSAELPVLGIKPPRGAWAYRFFRRAGAETTSRRIPVRNKREYLLFDPDPEVSKLKGNGLEGYVGKIVPINDEVSRLSAAAANGNPPSSINGILAADQLRLLEKFAHDIAPAHPEENLFVLTQKDELVLTDIKTRFEPYPLIFGDRTVPPDVPSHPTVSPGAKITRSRLVPDA